ncbi:16S rRNA (uracil(1498)-N(3))-methyltransferase [Marinobacter alexandrii]|uniref:16S rRNA (uracil(1498)-N(3))-methyltransferase n=1 Tax=Marinobacter alexandrii TaxID=2570351 RepID=UPI0032985520
MRIPRIFTGQVLQAESHFDLEPAPSQHLARALRMQEGAPIILFDGRGGQYAATISNVGKKHVSVLTGTHQDADVESPLAIHVGISISRGERMDWVVQKATELGVDQISPLITERTEVKLKPDRAEKKLHHWQQIATSACEQCGRNRLPVIHPLTSLSNWLDDSHAELKLVLHHRAENLPTEANPPQSIDLLIGPEGGLSADEIQLAERASFRSLRLGNRVLRTETAPVAALSILQARWGDMAP